MVTLTSTRLPTARTTLGARRRQDILHAARSVFIEHGYERASIDKIVKAFGSRTNAIFYHYFESKQDLLIEVVSAEIDSFLLEMKTPLDPDLDTRETLCAAGRSYLNALLDPVRAGILRLLIAEAAHLKELAKSFINSAIQGSHRDLIDYLAVQSKYGKLHCRNPALAADHFFSLIRGQPYIFMLFRLPPFGPGSSIESHVESATDLFLSGVIAQSQLP